MALVDITKSCIDSIRQISEHIDGAIVYLDAGCTESFQFIDAYSVLLDVGARAICSLENMCSLDAVVDWNSYSNPARKLVIITSCLLSDAHRYILRCLSTHQVVRHCIIFSSISETAHSTFPDSPLGPDAYQEYEALLVQDYEELVKKSGTNSSGKLKDEGHSQSPSSGKDAFHLEASSRAILRGDNSLDYIEDGGARLVVSVNHFPLILCPLSPRVFVLPSEGLVAEACLSAEHEDSISPGLPPISTGMLSDADDVPPGATLTAHFLYHLASKMDLKMEIFSLGDMSKVVGKLLTDMSSLYDVGRRKRSAGLLLIDRTLDLLTPCCHGDSLVDCIFSCLPRRSRTTSHPQVKSSGTQLKHGTSYLQRAPLDVQIPLGKILNEEDCKMDNFRLLESVEAFLCGWNSSSSDSQMSDLISFSQRIYDKSLNSDGEILTGSLISSENFRGTPFLEALLDRRTRDGALLVKKWLQETLRRDNVTLNVKSRPGHVTRQELQAMITALGRSQSSLVRNKGIIQLASATLLTLEESTSAKWDAFISAEKILSSSSGETSQNLAAQIGDLINKSALLGSHRNKIKKELSQGVFSLQDALLLMIVGYIWAGENFPTSGSDGPFSWQEEHLLKEAVVDAILENPSVAKLKFLDGLREELEANLSKSKSEETTKESPKLNIDDFDDDQWGHWGDEEADEDNKNELVYDDMQLKLELRDRVDHLFKFLHKLSGLKRKNIPMRDGSLTMETNFVDEASMGKGLLYKLLTRVLGKFDVPGLEYHSSTVGRLFKSGFGRFGLGQAKPSLADQNVILVFVIGGINGVEVREAHEALSESGRPDIELLVGGTTLLTPDDMLDLLLGESSYVRSFHQ
ncbi:sec1 family domain-containing protein MIP3 isoform X1 [Prosopis cineraria]|uniref:sec1 family domain-containing protein MIP3 isoform X1 n=2 Tax=Prosopis cineraria TaxID=364024 RepID=UPI00240F3D97|nr:sec1 family domain-containing protein MIP3 isoform X1 [Prosopis cineraria]XP_054811262.1 sec1 family domain-containing protein MIP3 isoform X1 [Prosopis cineraria]